MNFNEGVKYLTAVSNPWSHGLFMSIIWSVLTAAVAYLVLRDRRSSIILGLVVLSHWALDLLMHSNLPLFFEESPLLGLGLENSGPGFILITLFDLVILAIGLIVYYRTRKQKAQAV
jgi:membrane-bound metal-dependent hydrolase YbcI (DUF457 family)